MKKIDLNEGVKFYGTDVRAGTLFIAEGFQREHKNVLRVVKKHIERFENLGAVSERKFKSTGGRPVTEYWLNEQQAVFLGTLFRNQNDIVLDFKLNLVKKFFIMKNALTKIRLQKHDSEYIRARIEGKIPRRLETTILSELVPFAVSQGSEGYAKNPENCYINYTTMTNTALFIVAKGFKGVRNYLDKKQLRSVAVAEDIIADMVVLKMAEGLHYKEIHKEVKKKITAYGDILGKTSVPKIDTHKQLSLF